MASKTNRQKSSTRVPGLPAQPVAEGLVLLPLHLQAELPPSGLQAAQGAEAKREQREEPPSGSHVIVIDLD